MSTVLCKVCDKGMDAGGCPLAEQSGFPLIASYVVKSEKISDGILLRESGVVLNINFLVSQGRP